ncbi:hypothetical protein [Spongiactinospora rosea]|uniref:hypothetical protein n=1 Tax=Spongiactinospora rosea TaxID=2248750 RepID=UPI0011C06272|nr:hypothetical protein [Spongiactinospora rosea]
MSSTFTRDTYTSVYPEDAATAAEQTAALITPQPRPCHRSPPPAQAGRNGRGVRRGHGGCRPNSRRVG